MPTEKRTKSSKQNEAEPNVSLASLSAPPERPDPLLLLQEAEEMAYNCDLKPYVPVIKTLRGKGYSYREITSWLNERGVDTNYSAVYRSLQRSMSEGEGAQDGDWIPEEEREEGDHRN